MSSEVHLYIYPAGDCILKDAKEVSTALMQLLKKRLESSSLSKKVIIQYGDLNDAPPSGPNTYCIVTRMPKIPRGKVNQGTPQFVLVIRGADIDPDSEVKANGIFKFNLEKWDVDLLHKNTKKSFNAIIEDVKKKCAIQETPNSFFGKLWDYLIQRISSLIEAITSRFKTDKKQAASSPSVSILPMSPSNVQKPSKSAPEFHNVLFSSLPKKEEEVSKKSEQEMRNK